MAVHRIIEANAATRGDATAIADARITLSYRELNQRANMAARHLIAHGFRRGVVATVNLPRSAETAVILLGILKAGGAYVLIDAETSDAAWPPGVSLADRTELDEVRYRAVEMMPALARALQSCANLPIIAKASDVACAIPARNGSPLLLVPHATIMSLQRSAASPFVEWSDEPGAFDLWAGLMSGAAVMLIDPALRSAA
jgi:acyl-coenzyme A synthetase/AMP-(fatty) acid ligase